jgi:hypothetical protein
MIRHLGITAIGITAGTDTITGVNADTGTATTGMITDTADEGTGIDGERDCAICPRLSPGRWGLLFSGREKWKRIDGNHDIIPRA